MDLTYHCKSCGRLLCGKCMEGHESQILVASDVIKSLDEAVEFIKFCKFCRSEGDRKLSRKIYPSLSPRESPEPPSPSSIGIRTGDTINGVKTQTECFPRFVGAHVTDHSLHSAICSCVTSFSGQPSPVEFEPSSSRSDEEETEDSGDQFFSPSSECGHDDVSDTDMSSISVGHEFYNFKLLGSSSSYSPSRNRFTSNIVSHSVQQEQGEGTITRNDGPSDRETMAVLKKPDVKIRDPKNSNNFIDNLSIIHDQSQEKPLDFEHDGLFWYPPPSEENEIEDNFFEYDDDEDDIGESGMIFSSLRTLPSLFRAKEKQSEENKEPLRAVVQTHFRALVSQLLEGVNIETDKDTCGEKWLDIITKLAWKAANYVKPDTSRGGSMDPVDYVKVKCIATGVPNESTFIKGEVCTKNITHKRMTSQYKNARLLILGGALEYQRVPNQLSSFDTLLQQEIDHLKMIVRKIEAHRPNVLLVEKSVSSYAQGFLLEKGISLALNVKRTLLERIARSTGAFITSSIDGISTARLGHCELFRLERVSEDLETSNQFNRKPCKTLMYFEGCPKRLGCTVLLKGTCRQELKKLKHVVQYAVFAGYHLSLETSFLADEGASLPKLTLNPSNAIPEIVAVDSMISDRNSSEASTIEVSSIFHTTVEFPAQEEDSGCISPLSSCFDDNYGDVNRPCDENEKHLTSNLGHDMDYLKVNSDVNESTILPSDITNDTVSELLSPVFQEERLPLQPLKLEMPEKIDKNDPSNDYFSATESHQSILLSYSNRCVSKGTLCERSRLLRIQFYGCFDKPLGRYLHDDLFDQKTYCQSCNEPGEAHVQCFTHRQGSLTISVKYIPNLKLQGERDGKIWMWHRCLKCKHVNGIPPATHRVVMSDAAFGLSFGKFLELSFSNHATANRVATCGHSLQRDCLRYYGYGSMVAFFRYTPIDIFSVHLPPPIIEFNTHFQLDWMKKEAAEIFRKMETLYAEITGVLHKIEQRILSSGHKLETIELHNHIIELYDLVETERNDFDSLLQSIVDILELNDLRRSLIISSHVWDRRLQSLCSLLKIGSSTKETQAHASFFELKDCKNELSIKDGKINFRHEKNVSECTKLEGSPKSKLFPKQRAELSLHSLESGLPDKDQEHDPDGEINAPSYGLSLSDKIDSAWTVGMARKVILTDNPPLERIKSPMRVYSFDSALRVQDKIEKGFTHSSLHLSRLRSFHASSEHKHMIRTYSHVSPCEAQDMSSVFIPTPSLLSSASKIAEGARLLLPQTGHGNIVIAVYDNEPTSIISYALSSKEYDDLIADKPCEKEGSSISSFASWQSFGSLDLDNVQCGSYGTEEASSSISSMFTASKKSSHLKISFVDDSVTGGGKVKFSVTCYFAKQFQVLRKKCCPNEVDFVRSLSRCNRWSAQGGKSNVFFAKSLDDRFIIKQVTKTELESFGDFSPEYFKYLSDSLTSKSPTCIAKILGVYQISVKHLKGGRETKMVLMVMENLFFNRSVSRVYDLKGSLRSRYNPHTTGANSVLLDMNLLETLRTKPIFLGSKAKRSLERAVWNDTSFLASVDVMDYSLLVGVDEEGKDLVIGIIDIMRQYTWDKHLETWVKASGILGGPKNASPTIISPKQYKRRFRKAMTTYFLTVPDQWSS